MFRLYTGPDGESHIEDIEPIPVKVTNVTFGRMAPGGFMDWHPERRRQFVIQLAGEAENTASDGQVRRMKPGSIKLAEDLTGKGHQTRVIGNQECLWMFVVLAE